MATNCVIDGKKTDIFFVLGQSTARGNDSLPKIDVNQLGAISFSSGTIITEDEDPVGPVACAKNVKTVLGTTPASAMAAYVSRRSGDNLFVANLSRGGSDLHQILPGGDYWDILVKKGVDKSMELVPDKDVSGVLYFHGESDSSAKNSLAEYTASIRRIQPELTNEVRKIRPDNPPLTIFMLVNSNNSEKGSKTQVAQLNVSMSDMVNYPLVGPTYFAGLAGPKVRNHVSGDANYLLGLYTGRAYYQRFYEKRHPDAIMPIGVTRAGNQLKVHYNVPNPPLQVKSLYFSGTNPARSRTDFKNAGYKVYIGSRSFGIDSIVTENTSVVLTIGKLNDNITDAVSVFYALFGQPLGDYTQTCGGNICDSTVEPQTFTGPNGEEYASNMEHWVPNHQWGSIAVGLNGTDQQLVLPTYDDDTDPVSPPVVIPPEEPDPPPVVTPPVPPPGTPSPPPAVTEPDSMVKYGIYSLIFLLFLSMCATIFVYLGQNKGK